MYLQLILELCLVVIRPSLTSGGWSSGLRYKVQHANQGDAMLSISPIQKATHVHDV